MGICRGSCPYFNSRPRVEGVRDTGLNAFTYLISILALAWRASANAILCVKPYHISILALAWRASVVVDVEKKLISIFQFSPSRGGRHRVAAGIHVTDYFNSRPRVEGVIRNIPDNQSDSFISILALAWRASNGKAALV